MDALIRCSELQPDRALGGDRQGAGDVVDGVNHGAMIAAASAGEAKMRDFHAQRQKKELFLQLRGSSR